MSLFRPFNSPLFSEFRPLFRALNDHALFDYDESTEGSRTSTSRRAFSPNFDVHETETAYILEGELPGLSEKDKSGLEIEFTDENTLLIRGRIERSYQSQTPSEKEEPAEDKGKEKEHKPTVEDAPEGQVTKTSDKKEVQKKSDAPSVRYWVSERSIGSFQRSFTFPGLVDQDAVAAKLKDGVLTITVPKRQQPAGKKITVQ